MAHRTPESASQERMGSVSRQASLALGFMNTSHIDSVHGHTPDIDFLRQVRVTVGFAFYDRTQCKNLGRRTFNGSY